MTRTGPTCTNALLNRITGAKAKARETTPRALPAQSLITRVKARRVARVLVQVDASPPLWALVTPALSLTTVERERERMLPVPVLVQEDVSPPLWVPVTLHPSLIIVAKEKVALKVLVAATRTWSLRRTLRAVGEDDKWRELNWRLLTLPVLYREALGQSFHIICV